MTTNRLQPGFMVIHGNRQEDLRDVMFSWLQTHPLPPLTPEIILTQSNGMKQWLMHAIAQQTGICAGIQFYLPNAFIWQLYRLVLGEQNVPKHMAFDKAPLTWRLLRLLQQLPNSSQQSAAYQSLIDYLSTDSEYNSDHRDYQLAQQIADLYDQYQNYRADWIQLWSAGCCDLIDAQGRQQSLSDADQWQALLWQALQQDVQQQYGQITSRAHVHQQFVARIADFQGDLPQRVVLFGISSLAGQLVEALAALGQHTQVLLLVNNPCQYYWGDVQDQRYWRKKHWQQRRRHAIPQHKPTINQINSYASYHPLLVAWGKQGQDYIQLLSDFDHYERYAQWFSRIDYFNPPENTHLLATIQRSLLMLAEPNEVAPLPMSLDSSLQFACGYSAQREVEMLHDHLLALFDANPDLQPGDVMVMMPDINQFMAAIQAVFMRLPPQHPRAIPISIADNQQNTHPMHHILMWLLTLPEAEVSLEDWRSMFEVESIRRRFSLTESQVGQLDHWLQQAAVRWGLDGNDRYIKGQLPINIEANSWLFAIERLLLGYATGADGETWQSVLPIDSATSTSADLLAQLLQWVEAIRIAQALLSQPLTPSLWCIYLQEVLDLFFDSNDQDHQATYWLTQCRQALMDWLTDCERANFSQPIALSVVASVWLDKIETAQQQHRPLLSGKVQFSTLIPMRAIPFKVICLIGMNERDYPRQHPSADFDLMQRPNQWRAGDRSRRYDDRYLLLEVLLSAREHLYISWTGRSIIDNQPQLPSILISQFIDYLQQDWQIRLDIPCYPLQPFSARYTDPNETVTSYAQEWFQCSDNPSEMSLSLPLANDELLTIRFSQLFDLLRYPQRIFWQHRLHVYWKKPKQVDVDEETFDVDSLGSYQLRQEAIDSGWLTQSFSQSTFPWRLAGKLPLAHFADMIETTIMNELMQLKQQWQQACTGYHSCEPLHLFVDVQGQLLETILSNCYTNITLDEEATKDYIRLVAHPARDYKPHHVITPWLEHLLAACAGYTLTSTIIFVNQVVRFSPMSADDARHQLISYLDYYRQAWQAPLGVSCKAGLAYCEALMVGKHANDVNYATKMARQTFYGNSSYSLGEVDSDSALKRSFLQFDVLLEQGFSHIAMSLYAPMLQAIIQK